MASDIITSIVTGGSNNHATVAEEANGVATDFVTPGVVGVIGNTSGVAPCTGSFGVSQDASPSMSVTVNSGAAYVTGTPSSQSSQKLRARMGSNYTSYVISANSSGSTKYDWIYLSLSAANAANPSATADNVITLFTSRSTSNVTDNGTPPTYGLPLAVVAVANGASSIVNANITDKRPAAVIGVPAVVTDWTSIATAPNTVTYNGNGSYSLVFNGVDYTNILSAGQRIKTTRTVAAPTQCTSLNGTNQYWVKTSPNKLTFTDDFVVDAYVKLTQYGASSHIVSRYNGTSGWGLEIGSTGQVYLTGYNAASANFSQVYSYQSIPLNKWVRVTAQLDMSAFTATTTTSYIMIDGVDVPSTVYRAGTNPTALVQAGNLEIGSKNGGTTTFPGKIAQYAVHNAKVTQATMRTYMSQGYTGSEPTLACGASFNGVATDLNTTTPNDLTAQNSAGYVTDSPFGDYGTSSTLDYGIIMAKPTFSTNTTVVVQAPEGCTFPTSGGISAISYSGLDTPYGFPKDEGRWTVDMINLTDVLQSSPVQGTYYNLGSQQLNVPVGKWKLSVAATIYSASTSGVAAVQSYVSTSASTATDTSFGGDGELNQPVAIGCFAKSKYISTSTPTTYYLITKNTSGTTPLSIYNFGARGGTILSAENALL